MDPVVEPRSALDILSLPLSGALVMWMALVSSPASAEIRKWVDEDGQVHYEDAPKGAGGARQSATEEDSGQGLTPERERLQKQKRLLEAMESERSARRQEKEKADKERREAAARCEAARHELSRRRNAGYLYRKGKDGEREVFTDEEHAGSIAEAEAAVKKSCK